MEKSCVELAYEAQGVQISADGNIINDDYPGHDTFQNGVIPYGSDSTFYFTQWYPGQGTSGFFTDQATIDSCSHDGVLNSNELCDALQTKPSNYSWLQQSQSNDRLPEYQEQKPLCMGYDIDWDRLDALRTENPDLYNNLTNIDGRTPGGRDIKCAYGRVESNRQFGDGGGNQYYIDKPTLKSAMNEGVFRENPGKSFQEQGITERTGITGNLTREAIPVNADSKKKCSDIKNAVVETENSKPEAFSTPEYLNSTQVPVDPAKPYSAFPDESYHYGQASDFGQNNYGQDGIQQGKQGSPYMTNAPPEQKDGNAEQSADQPSETDVGSGTENRRESSEPNDGDGRNGDPAGDAAPKEDQNQESHDTESDNFDSEAPGGNDNSVEGRNESGERNSADNPSAEEAESHHEEPEQRSQKGETEGLDSEPLDGNEWDNKDSASQEQEGKNPGDQQSAQGGSAENPEDNADGSAHQENEKGRSETGEDAHQDNAQQENGEGATQNQAAQQSDGQYTSEPEPSQDKQDINDRQEASQESTDINQDYSGNHTDEQAEDKNQSDGEDSNASEEGDQAHQGGSGEDSNSEDKAHSPDVQDDNQSQDNVKDDAQGSGQSAGEQSGAEDGGAEDRNGTFVQQENAGRSTDESSEDASSGMPTTAADNAGAGGDSGNGQSSEIPTTSGEYGYSDSEANKESSANMPNTNPDHQNADYGPNDSASQMPSESSDSGITSGDGPSMSTGQGM